MKVIRSIVTPGVEEVRAWLADWAVAYPDDPWVRLLCVERGRTGRPAPGREAAFLLALVAGSEESCPPDDALDPAGLDLGGLPFRLTLGRDWAQFSHSHAPGDGFAAWYFLGMLLAPGDRQGIRSGQMTGAPLARGLLRVFGPPGSRLPHAIAIQRELRHLRASSARPAVERAARSPSFAVVTAVSSDSFTQRVRVFRAARGSAASVMSIMTMRALLLCRHHGLTVDGSVAFMVDLRRYLLADASVDGNFSWSKSVPVPDSDTPTQLSARIGGILDSGLPLLIFGDALRHYTILRPGRSPARQHGDRTVRLMISYATKWANAPQPAGSASPRITVSIAPPGPNFVGFNVVEAYGCIHVSMNWCTATLDRAVAERIAAEFVAEPGAGPIDESIWER
ncbi:hypothetical protein [Nocardia sp. NBC_01327]|uniref:hypothetical protein n=1 Tax=Nocardia sp. NBC_01327 TaxID=2903593 RepID=UPI002E16390E|nr:hypothetical protein OG326_18765 [Nocardia sp. NBC_01327]